MSQTTVEQFLGRILTESVFLEQLLSCENNRRSEAFKKGYTFTDAEWEAIQAMDLTKFSTLSQLVSKRIKRGR